MLNNYFCKECKDILKTFLLHGEKYFIETPYIPYKLSFLRVNCVSFLAFYPPLALSSGRYLSVSEAKA